MSFASQALTGTGDDERRLDSVAARAQSGSAAWLCGRLGTAERISSSIERWRAAGVQDMLTLWCQYLGRIQRAQGRLDEALGTYRRALEVATAPGQPTLPGAGAAHIGIAEVAYERDQLDVASHHLMEGLALCRQFLLPDALAPGSATLAWIRQSRGDAAGALEAMAEAERAADPSMADLINPVPAQRARLLLSQGDLDTAARWSIERGLSADDEPLYGQEPAYLVLARVLIAQEQPGQALELLGRLHTAASAEQRIGSVIEIQALRALALAAGGNEGAGVATLTEALTLAHPQGYVRVFADEGPPMAALLGALLAGQRFERTSVRELPVDYLGRLMRSLTERPAGVDPTAMASAVSVSGLVVQLSERELDVLRRLANGQQNQQIASELYLALNTVKKHVTHIFEKLGAAHRTEAATRARELGLLS